MFKLQLSQLAMSAAHFCHRMQWHSEPSFAAVPKACASQAALPAACLHGKRSAAIDDRSFSSISGELEEVIAF